MSMAEHQMAVGGGFFFPSDKKYKIRKKKERTTEGSLNPN